MLENQVRTYGSGAGSRLPTEVLVLAGVFTAIAVVVSATSIYLQLKNYRKPFLQRMVVRIMVMVPLYAIASLISIFSLEAAFVIDAIRDIYEAFVIYCFFVLLLSYLGGERSLLILLHGRPPKSPVFPVSLWRSEIDVSDPGTFLFLKRGILQYVQVKPTIAVVTLILKAVGKFNEGDFRYDSGYLYVSIVYNTSMTLSLYCLAIFWLCVNEDLKPFRPVPKFLCVKGILFFSFWQGIVVSMLVAAGAIKKLGPYTDREHISLGLTDTLICLEMPFFAMAHLYAFSYTDYLDRHCSFAARMPVYYAFRDAFGLMDVIEDSKRTVKGEGMEYRDFEPSEGQMHQGVGRERRIRAGLRYSKGGKQKYWLPKPTEGVYAPLLNDENDPLEGVVHNAPDLANEDEEDNVWGDGSADAGYDLPFGDPDEEDDELFEHSKKYLFGDYNYPVIDVSSENARNVMRDEEERILRDERGAWFSPIRGAKGLAAREHRDGPAWQGYGAINDSSRSIGGAGGSNGKVKDKASKNSGHQASSQIARNGAVIDHDQDQNPPSQQSTSEIRLRWTKNKPWAPPLDSKGGQHLLDRADSSQESSSSGKRRPRSPLTMSRSSSAKAASSSPATQNEDAVDLIVEDSKAAEEDMTRERRKGEPAIRGSALRKVYKTVVVEEDGKKVVEDIVETRNSREDEDSVSSPTLEDEDGVVATTVEPPDIVQRVFSPFEEEGEGGNPWA